MHLWELHSQPCDGNRLPADDYPIGRATTCDRHRLSADDHAVGWATNWKAPLTTSNATPSSRSLAATIPGWLPTRCAPSHTSTPPSSTLAVVVEVYVDVAVQVAWTASVLTVPLQGSIGKEDLPLPAPSLKAIEHDGLPTQSSATVATTWEVGALHEPADHALQSPATFGVPKYAETTEAN
eukprot:m.71312 g.71312  ORF g.71312 m.71312 type:complete len:181 (+) comp10061_c0_seq1:119-661(+)